MNYARNNMFTPRMLRCLPFRPGCQDKIALAKQNWELVNDFCNWLLVQRYHEHTCKAYCKVVREFCQFMGDKPFREATHADIRSFIAVVINRTLSLDNGRRNLMVLRLFFDFLYLGGAIESIPPRSVYLRYERRKRLPHTLSEAQIGRLIEFATNVRDRAVVELLYATGCRSCELVGIRVSDVNFRKRTIRVYGKGKERMVLFGRKAALALREYLGDRRDGYLFERWQPQPRGCVSFDRSNDTYSIHWMDYSSGLKRQRSVHLGYKISRTEALARFERIKRTLPMERPRNYAPLQPKAIARIVTLAAIRARLGYVTPYVVRHSFATHLLDRGADIRHIQELLGHENITSTQLYTRVSATKIRAVYNRFHPRK